MGLERDFYQIAIDSVECYAKAHGYQFILTHDKDWGCDYLNDQYFRRHCVIAKILPKFEAILHLDADIGVVNPNRKLQELLDENIDITFYDRHFNPEIAIGSYLAKNTSYAMEIIKDFSEYERKLPNSYHGTENGALHIFLAEKLFPHNLIELELCRRAWSNSLNVVDQFAYTSCIKTLFGANTDFGKVRISRKGTGHVRDGWLTNGIFSPERDFMLHGWKMNQLATLPPGRLLPVPKFVDKWYNPFHGEFDMQKCGLGNTTWNVNQKFVGTKADVEYSLRRYEMRSAIQKISSRIDDDSDHLLIALIYSTQLYITRRNLISNCVIILSGPGYVQYRFDCQLGGGAWIGDDLMLYYRYRSGAVVVTFQFIWP